MIHALRHVGITVFDLNSSLKFYRDLLGLEVVIEDYEESKYIDTISGFNNIKLKIVKLTAGDGVVVELLYYLSHPSVPSYCELYKVGISHVAFRVGDVDSLYDKLVKEGIKFNSSPQISPNNYAKVAFCRDPDGNSVELVEVL